MNLNYQQLPLANPFAGIGLAGTRAAQTSYRLVPRANLGSLQRDQVIGARFDEPAAIEDLRRLREEERNTDDPITIRAFSDAFSLLEFVHLILNRPLRTLLAADSEGGIRIEWLRDDRTVRVVIPAREEEPAYIYQRLGRVSDIKQFSKSSVVQTLRSIIFTP